MVESVKKVTVIKINNNELYQQAIYHYDSQGRERFARRFSVRRNRKNTPEFIARIQVNYIRLYLTDYDHIAESEMMARGYTREAFEMACDLYAGIARVYPELAHECQRQLTQREGCHELSN